MAQTQRRADREAPPDPLAVTLRVGFVVPNDALVATEFHDVSHLFLILIGILSVAGIFWLVIYSARRGQEHRERTTIKAPESRQQRPPAG